MYNVQFIMFYSYTDYTECAHTLSAVFRVMLVVYREYTTGPLVYIYVRYERIYERVYAFTRACACGHACTRVRVEFADVVCVCCVMYVCASCVCVCGGILTYERLIHRAMIRHTVFLVADT